MYKSFLLLILLVFFAACSGESAKKKDEVSKASNASAATVEDDVKLSAEELAAVAAEKAKAEAKRLSLEASEKLQTLNDEFAAANAQWMEVRRSIKDADESQSHFEARPSLKYADDLVALANQYPETEAAKEVWPLALKWGLGDSKFKAGEVLLDLAKADETPGRSMEKLEYLMKHAVGEPQKEAMQLMLAKAKKDIESAQSFEIIKKLLKSNRGMIIAREGYLLPNGNEEVKAETIKELKLLVQSDVKAPRAIESLGLMFRHGSEETKSVALQQLIEHHVQHESTLGFIRSLCRTVNTDNEATLKKLVEHPNDVVKANAMVSLSQFFTQKQLEAQYYESAPQVALQGLGEERAEYLKTKIAPEYMAELESKLSSYVEGHKAILDSAEKELFAMKNLAIGKTAPEIVGNDLDGVEFKLSDYRGKVVFLDFWGDW